MVERLKDSPHPPWCDQTEWQQVQGFFLTSWKNTCNLAEVEKLAAAIEQKLSTTGGMFATLCEKTCVSCRDICCARATIWYDFGDLLFLYALQKELPAAQIVKVRGAACPWLSRRGCTLPRIHRPFVCSWYVCSLQKLYCEQQGELERMLGEIKVMRARLEDIFIAAIHS